MAKLWNKIKSFSRHFKRAFTIWNDHEPFNNSIIISYYTIFSLPGLLVIIINLAGYFFGYEAVTDQIATQIQGLVGGDTAEDVQEIVANASASKESTIASVIGIGTLLFGATGVFYQLQQILNKIWNVKPKPKQKLLRLIRDRFFSFGLILAIGFLLLVSLVISAGLTALSDWVAVHISEALLIVFRGADLLVSAGVITLLFAAIYKFLPDATIRWREVWPGALVTAVLFVIAKFALGLYFGKSDPASTYGAAGSVILIMLWVSYSGLILLYGAAFTYAYATRNGREIKPTPGAEKISDTDNGASKKQETQQRNLD
ncbi:YihY/virulence factor BrkB family protein [Pseudochryseolinea flava]|uniref:Ribonuclease BN n=1 Tax=Pseudochryseolinea flava TaxID=2059302 RepID=A0A364Y0H2_9BACT|nr:YihY/virulence factor BrkB family protein [Pseudochryseolinea flava]RAW00284.1 ribonuclease BN [Pseudochryseolinea flava]